MFDRLQALVGDRRVVPPIPHGRVPFTAHDEVAHPAGVRDHASSWAGYIVYANAANVRTERRITCHQISGFGCAETVVAFCHERGAIRSFRIDRIQELVCTDTGEILDPASFFDWLRLTGALAVNDKALHELIRILVFLSRCDGVFHPLEERALEDTIGRYVRRFGGDDKTIADALSGARKLAPDGLDLTKAARRLATAQNARELCRFVLACGADIIDADGVHSPEEIAWAVELSDGLKRAAH